MSALKESKEVLCWVNGSGISRYILTYACEFTFFFYSWKSSCPLPAAGLIQSLMKPLCFDSDLVFAVCSQGTSIKENKDLDTFCKSFVTCAIMSYRAL